MFKYKFKSAIVKAAAHANATSTAVKTGEWHNDEIELGRRDLFPGVGDGFFNAESIVSHGGLGLITLKRQAAIIVIVLYDGKENIFVA